MASTLRMRTTISPQQWTFNWGGGGGGGEGDLKADVYGIGESFSQRTYPGYIWIENL